MILLKAKNNGEIKYIYDKLVFSLLGKSVNLHEFEAEAVASLVKLYLRELPENILTAALLPKFNELSGKKKIFRKYPSLTKFGKTLKSCHLWFCFHNIFYSPKLPLTVTCTLRTSFLFHIM